MLSLSGTRIISTVFTNNRAEPAFRSYTLPNTPFYFRVRWENEAVKQFYSEFEIVWDFGDGTTTTGVTAEHFYKWPGMYAVRAAITDINGDPNYIYLESELTVENAIPDIVTFDNIYSEANVIFTVPAGRRTPPLKIYRFSSWQNDKILKDKDYTINFFASGGKSNYMGVSSYYSSKWSHLKPYFGFVEYSINENNYIQQKIVESSITTNTKIYAEKFLDLNSPDRWDVKLRFYHYPKEGTVFCGTSGEIPSNKTIHFVDQKACDINDQKDVIFLYAYPDTRQITDKDSLDYEFDMSDLPNGILNYPWNTQVVKTTFNPASGLRFTSNGIGIEGPNVSVGPLTGQFLYSFDIFPTKWSGTKIPFVISYKDSDNYTTKTYPQIISHNSSPGLPSELNTLKIFLMEYVDSNPFEFTDAPVVKPVNNSDYVILKSEEVPNFENGCYYAGVLSANREIKVACLSAFALIQDINQPITFPGYAYIMQQGTRAVRRFERRLVFDHKNEEKLNITFSEITKTFFCAGTGGTTITYAPLRTFDVDTKDYVWITDADNDKIYVFDQDGEPINNRFGGALRRSRVNFIDTESFTLKRSNSVAPINVKGRGEKNAEKRSSSPCQIAINSIGDAWITLYDTISTFKFDKNDFYARASAIPNLSRKDQIFLNELDPVLNASFKEYTTNFNLFSQEFFTNPTTLEVAKYRPFTALNLAYSGVQSFFEIIVQGDLPPNTKIQVPVTEPRGQTTNVRQALQSIFENKRHELQQRTVNYVNSTYYSILSSPTLSAKCFRDSGYIIDSIAADLANNANHRSIEVGQVYFSGPVLIDSDKTGSTVPTLPKDQVYATAESITAIGPTMAGLLPYEFWDSSERYMLSGFNVIGNIILDKNNTPRTFPGAPVPANNFNTAAREILNNRSFIQQSTVEFVKTNFPTALFSDIPGGSEALSAKCFRDTGFIVDSIAADLINNANHRSIETGLFYLSGAVLNSSFTNTIIPTLPQNQVDATVAAISAIGSIITNLLSVSANIPLESQVITKINTLANTVAFSIANSGASLAYDPPGIPPADNIEFNKRRNIQGLLQTNKQKIQDRVADYVVINGYFNSVTASPIIQNKFNIFKSVIADQNSTPPTTPSSPVPDNTFNLAAQTILSNKQTLQQRVVEFVKHNYPFALDDSIELSSDALSAKCYRDTGYIIDSIAADILNNANHRSIETGVFYFSGALLARIANLNSPVPVLPEDQVEATIQSIKAVGKFISGLNMPVEQSYTTLGLLSSDIYYTTEQLSMLSSINNFTYVISNSANIPTTTPRGVTNSTHRLASQIILENKELIQTQTVDYIKITFPNALTGETQEQSDELANKCFRDTGFIVESLAADILNNANHRSIETGSFYFSGALLARDFNTGSDVPTLPTNQVQATIAAMVKIGELIINEITGTAAEVRIPQINLLIDAVKYPLENNGASLSYSPAGAPTSSEQVLGNLILQNKETIQREVSGYVLQKKYLSEIEPQSQSQILTLKCNRDVGFMVDAIAADLISGVKAKSIQYAVAYWDGSTSRIPDSEVPNQRLNTLDTIEKLKSVLLDISVESSTSNLLLKKIVSLVDTMTYPLENNGAVLEYNPKNIPTLEELEIAKSLISNKQAIQKDVARYVRNQRYLTVNTPFSAEYISKCNRDVGLMIDAVASDLQNGVTSKTVQYAVAYWDGSTSRLPEDILPSQVANTLDTIDYLIKSTAITPYAVKCNRDVGFMLDAVMSDIENGVIAKSIQYGLAYWDGSTSRLPETEIKNQVLKTIDTVSFLRDRCIELIISSLGTNSELVTQIFDLAKTVAFPLETGGRSRLYSPPGLPLTTARQDAYNILKKNRSTLQRAIRQEVQALNFLNSVQLDKCTRDVGLMVDAIANDILTGVRSRSIQYGLAYYDGAVARTTRLGVFPSPQVGATANTVLSLGDKIYNLLITEKLIPDNNKELFGGTNLDYYDSGGFAGENTILPTAVDVDVNDNVFVAYSHPLNSFIVKYDNEGNQRLIIALPENYQAQQLLVDVEGNCWVGVINTNSMLEEDDPQLSQTTPFLNNRIDFIYCFKTTPSTTSPDSDIVTDYFKREYQLVGDFTMDSYGNIWFNTNVNQLNVINVENKPKQYIIGNPASALTFTQDFGGIAGDINNFIWIINNAESKLQILNVLDPFNVDPKDIISFALPGVSFSLAPENQYAYYVTTGDFTGIRWLLKNKRGKSVAGPRVIEGVSNLFSINKPGPFIVKKNENYNLSAKIKSFALQEKLATSDILFDEFMGTLLNGNNRTVLELGKVIYERIANFLENHYDVDTCSLESLESLYRMYGFKFKKFFTSLPTTVRRAVNLLSINHKKLFGSSNTFNTNFLLSSYFADPKSNIGRELSIGKDRFIVGEPIITYEYFSKKYTLVPNTLILEPDAEIGKPYPLSGVSYDWGWGLVLGSKGQRGLEVGKYYKFFEFLPKDRSAEVYDNIIDFDDDLTTLTPYNSSYSDWIKYAGYLDTAISSMLYEGFELFTSKDKVFDGFIEPIPAPTPTSTPTITVTETPTPTPTPTITDTPRPTKTSYGLITNLLDKVVDQNFDPNQIATVPYIPQFIYSDIANLTINIEEPFTYIIVQDNIDNFTLLFESINGISVQNLRDILNFYNNKLLLTPTEQVSSNKTELFVTQTCNISTIKGLYTLYYFNTGSIILGASYVTFALPPLSDYPVPPLRLRKLWNDVVIWDDADIWYEG